MSVQFIKKSHGSNMLIPKLDYAGGGITLSVEDSREVSYAIVSIGPDGKLSRHYGVPGNIGLVLDETGRIALASATVMPEAAYMQCLESSKECE